MQGAPGDDPLTLTLAGVVRDWFLDRFPQGPTPAQSLAWPVIQRGENLLLTSPTGTGKTLAAFLATIDRLCHEHEQGSLEPGLRCVYLSPLKSLGRDVERNLNALLDSIKERLGLAESPIKLGVRTGDTTAYARRKLRESPPHVLITTPESLSLLLSQASWRKTWKSVQQIIVDEVHSFVPTKRGTDLALSLERLSTLADRDPQRIGMSATCRPSQLVARFLVGTQRACNVIEAEGPLKRLPTEITVESLLKSDEAAHRGLTYRRLVHRLSRELEGQRTTLVFANTRVFTEKLTHDLRLASPERVNEIAAHHGSLDAARRHEVENAMKRGDMRLVITSTSLELGIDIGHADLSILVGLPGSIARCLQRIGRAGHRPEAQTRGVLIAATHAELIGAAVTARAARAGRLEPVRMVERALDVLCQQLIGIACVGECSCDRAFEIVKQAAPMADLSRSDFDACLAFLAGELTAPAGQGGSTASAEPRWTSPRLWKSKGHFGIRSHRVIRWFWSNVGTITSEQTMTVVVDDRPIGRLESEYAERLQAGDRFLLDGRSLICKRNTGETISAINSAGDPNLPRWTSDRVGLTNELSAEVAQFRSQAAHLLNDGPSALRAWLDEAYQLDSQASSVIEALIQAQEARSEVPSPEVLLIEEYPDPETGAPTLACHAPLGRAACEAIARAMSARLGRLFGRNIDLRIADLGWSIRLPEEAVFQSEHASTLIDLDTLETDLMEGLDHGELPALRFRHIASTALMVLKNPEGGKTKVGGSAWVSKRLYPLVKACASDHPLLKEVQREIFEDLLDLKSARDWLATRPTIRYRKLDAASPFAAAWIDPSSPEDLIFEAPDDALRRLHRRLALVPTEEPQA